LPACLLLVGKSEKNQTLKTELKVGVGADQPIYYLGHKYLPGTDFSVPGFK
jgi:hypothetical protein